MSFGCFRFGGFCLDLPGERLLAGKRAIPLTPKAFALLRLLLERAGAVVRTDELLDELWPNAEIGEAVVKFNVGEVRKALGDDARKPRFIETVHRRGYRFAAPVAYAPAVPCAGSGEEERARPEKAGLALVVGRERELHVLSQLLEKARGGERQTVFVAGAAGMGKTTLVDAFVARVAAPGGWAVGRGECLQQASAGEAYLPILQALGRLAQDSGDGVTRLLAHFAPTWLVHLPWLQTPRQREALRREVLGAAPTRTLRELAELVDALAARRPLVLILEDLHWGDGASVEALAMLARRRERAALLIVCTYRPTELILAAHPLRALRHELAAHHMSRELHLELLVQREVEEYLAARFPGMTGVPALAEHVFRHTEGHPLFMASLVEDLASRGLVRRDGAAWDVAPLERALAAAVPESVRALILATFERLNESEQAILSGAAAVGVELSAAAVAAALGAALSDAEAGCEALAQTHGILTRSGVDRWPDGTVAGRYRFVHSLQREVAYALVGEARRAALHRAIASRYEAAWGEQAGEIAGELAQHWENAGDPHAAARALEMVARNAVSRSAHRQALDVLDHALALLAPLPERERTRPTLQLLLTHGLVRRLADDMPAAAADFELALALARRFGAVDVEVRALLHLALVLFWLDRPRCLTTLVEARDRSRTLCGPLPPPYLSERSSLPGRLGEDARAAAAAVEAARRVGDGELAALWVALGSPHAVLRCDYQRACQESEQGMQSALAAGNAYHSMLCQLDLGWALLHAGRWGEMFELVHGGLGAARKNGNQHAAASFLLQLVWLCWHLGDTAGMREAGARLLAAVDERAFDDFFAGLQRATAHVGLGADEALLAGLANLVARLEAEAMSVDWMLYLPLELAAAERSLDRGDLATAGACASRLAAVAGVTGETAYRALAGVCAGRVAAQRREWRQAEAHASESAHMLAGVDAPWAAWRVHAFKAFVLAELGRRQQAARARRRAAAGVRRLAASLGTLDEARCSFLGRPEVAGILAEVGR